MSVASEPAQTGKQGDPWRNYRIAVGVMTGLAGIYAAQIILVIAMFFAGIVVFFSLPNMSGSIPRGWEDPGILTIIIALVSGLFFAWKGFKFSRNSGDGRTTAWIASLITLPIGIFSIWVLTRTAPGTNHAPPKNRTAITWAIGVAAIAAVFIGLRVSNEHKREAEQIARADSEFIQAIQSDDIEKIRTLLEQGEDPNQTTKLGATALMYALERLDYDASMETSEPAALLLEYGADPNRVSRMQDDLEYQDWVATEEDKEFLTYNVDRDKLEMSYRQHTPLVVALYRNDLVVAELLLEKGADVNAYQLNGNMNTPLLNELPNIEFAQALNAPPAQASSLSEPSPLVVAVNTLNLGIVQVMLDRGAQVDPYILSDVWPRVFEEPEEAERRDIVKLILEHGAHPNARADILHETPLMAATTSWNVATVKLLLKYGADPDQLSLHDSQQGRVSPRVWIQELDEDEVSARWARNVGDYRALRKLLLD